MWRGLQQPTQITHAGDGSRRLFILEKAGIIRVVEAGALLPAPFLDLTLQVGSSGSEQGLLGLAFHPRYTENGLFFVNYTDLNGNTVVERYRVSADPNAADSGSGEAILHVAQPFANHNGGNLVFGPDGYLWIGFGDGGSAGDPRGNAQNPRELLGKMLRIDVDGPAPYGIPPDNPFVNRPGFRPEIWALGLRNPWRYAFDWVTGDLFIADVGQNEIEEIDFQPAGSPGGENYGWNRMEGSRCFRSQTCDTTGLVMPVAEYDHNQGCSVTGGYVYRGSQYRALYGAYYFADFCSGRVWSLHRDAAGSWVSTQLLQSPAQVSSFGEDEAGELYLTGYADGVVYELTAESR